MPRYNTLSVGFCSTVGAIPLTRFSRTIGKRVGHLLELMKERVSQKCCLSYEQSITVRTVHINTHSIESDLLVDTEKIRNRYLDRKGAVNRDFSFSEAQSDWV